VLKVTITIMRILQRLLSLLVGNPDAERQPALKLNLPVEQG